MGSAPQIYTQRNTPPAPPSKMSPYLRKPNPHMERGCRLGGRSHVRKLERLPADFSRHPRLVLYGVFHTHEPPSSPPPPTKKKQEVDLKHSTQNAETNHNKLHPELPVPRPSKYLKFLTFALPAAAAACSGEGGRRPSCFLVHGWDSTENLNFYSLMSLCTLKNGKCHTTMTKIRGGGVVGGGETKRVGVLASGFFADWF